MTAYLVEERKEDAIMKEENDKLMTQKSHSPDDIQQKSQQQEKPDSRNTAKADKKIIKITTLILLLIYLFLLYLSTRMLCSPGSITEYFIFVGLIGIIPIIIERFIIGRLIGVVMVLFALLLAYDDYIQGEYGPVKRMKAQTKMAAIETALKMYRLHNGTYPTTDLGLQALVEQPQSAKNWQKGGYLEKGRVPKDPWGNDYIYLCPGNHGDFDIISYGADGKPGGKGKDINNWELDE